jgi:protocatechuate 3,4-dioxygenase beta subunit
VRAEKEPQFWWSGSVEATDAQGRFEVAGLDPGTYSVIARHADFRSRRRLGHRGRCRGTRGPLDRPHRGRSRHRRLVDSEERPLAGRVAAQEFAGQPMARALIELLRAEAGADGRFRIERLPPGSYALGVLAPRFAGRRVEAEVSGAEPVVDLGDIALEQGLAIRGRVRSITGAPIPTRRSSRAGST